MSVSTRLPPIAMTMEDRKRLELLANAGMARFPQAADFLAREIERARVVEGDCNGQHLIRMGTALSFRDDGTGQVRDVTLVYPEDADVSAGKISVLTPIGAALIGLSPGQSIEWETPAGDSRSLTVISVGDPAGA